MLAPEVLLHAIPLCPPLSMTRGLVVCPTCLLFACLQGVDLFDAPFFHMGRAEAIALDPQTRLLLQVTQQAFANAGGSTTLLLPSPLLLSQSVVTPAAAACTAAPPAPLGCPMCCPYCSIATPWYALQARCMMLPSWQQPPAFTWAACSGTT